MASWTITDNSTGSPVVFTFPISPNSFEPPGRQAQIKAEGTTGSAGGTIMFQGRDAVPELSFSGTINSETFHDNLLAEFDKWYDLILTDDQGAQWNIVFVNYTLERKKSATNHHRYQYNVSAKVLV
jgi:hypothetical protein